MVHEAYAGIAAFGRTPTWKRVTSANNLWTWEREDLDWYFKGEQLEELSLSSAHMQDELRYFVRNVIKRLEYAC